MSSVSPMSPIVSAPIAAKAYGDRVLVSRVLVRRGGGKKGTPVVVGRTFLGPLFFVPFLLPISFGTP